MPPAPEPTAPSWASSATTRPALCCAPGSGAEGVDVSHLRTLPGPTPVVTVRQDDDAGFDCVACPRHFLPFEPSAEDADFLAGFDLIHLASTSRSDVSVPPLGATSGLSLTDSPAAPARTTPSCRSSPMPPCRGAGLGEAEAADLAVRLQRRGPRLVTVTRGAAGVTVCLRGEGRRPGRAAAGSTIDTWAVMLSAHLVVRLCRAHDLAVAWSAAARYVRGPGGSPGGFGRGGSQRVAHRDL